jgi:predicted ATPase
VGIQSITVSGYKAYAQPATLKICPLTLVYGLNSAGKSSLIRLLPLLRSSFIGNSATPFQMGTAATRGAGISELFTKSRSDDLITLKFQFTEEAPTTSAIYKIRLHQVSSKRQAVIESLEIQDRNQSVGKVVIELDLNSLKPPSYASLRYQTRITRRVEPLENFKFIGIRPTFEQPRLLDKTVGCINNLSVSLQGLSSLTWIGPLRKAPARLEPEYASLPILDEHGVGASQAIRESDSLDKSVSEEVSRWFRSYTGHSLEVVPSAGPFGELFSLTFSPIDNPKLTVPVEDVGEGMGQIIPVLTAASLAAHGKLGTTPTVVIEHPDLHLHSTVHFGVLDFFCELVSRSAYGPRFVIETHSEAMLLALQLAIVDKRISHKDVVLHWIKKRPEGGAEVVQIELDANAIPVDRSLADLDWYYQVHSKISELANKRFASV